MSGDLGDKLLLGQMAGHLEAVQPGVILQPEVCVNKWRMLIWLSLPARPSDGRDFVVHGQLPSWASRRMAAAVNCLVTEPISKRFPAWRASAIPDWPFRKRLSDGLAAPDNGHAAPGMGVAAWPPASGHPRVSPGLRRQAQPRQENKKPASHKRQNNRPRAFGRALTYPKTGVL